MTPGIPGTLHVCGIGHAGVKLFGGLTPAEEKHKRTRLLALARAAVLLAKPSLVYCTGRGGWELAVALMAVREGALATACLESEHALTALTPEEMGWWDEVEKSLVTRMTLETSVVPAPGERAWQAGWWLACHCERALALWDSTEQSDTGRKIELFRTKGRQVTNFWKSWSREAVPVTTPEKEKTHG